MQRITGPVNFTGSSWSKNNHLKMQKNHHHQPKYSLFHIKEEKYVVQNGYPILRSYSTARSIMRGPAFKIGRASCREREERLGVGEFCMIKKKQVRYHKRTLS